MEFVIIIIIIIIATLFEYGAISLIMKIYKTIYKEQKKKEKRKKISDLPIGRI